MTCDCVDRGAEAISRRVKERTVNKQRGLVGFVPRR